MKKDLHFSIFNRIKPLGFFTSHLTAFIACLFFISCSQHKHEAAEPNVYYTCSMDPQVMEKHPGKCPICHMQLTKVETMPGDINTIRLSAQQIQLGNIGLDTLKLQNVSDEKILTGTTVINEKKIALISSRVAGRIDRLYFKTTGEKISKGQKIYDIYSEELINQQRNFLLAYQKKNTLNNIGLDFDRLADAARNQLLLSGLTDEQIETLQLSGEIETNLPVYSSENGTIIKMNIN
jgi:Cu(I)/Ag(I) efflux system membrane fusion protein